MTQTNQLTREITKVLIPRAALIAYSTSVQFNDESSRQYFLEVRDIGPDGIMREGRPVTVEFMNALVRNYSESYTAGIPHGIIPSRLLFCNPTTGTGKYVWYSPPGKRVMFFVRDLGIENGEYNVPGIVYEAEMDALNVYAYKGDKPDYDTELYAAPFFNVTGESVCLGSARIRKPDDITYAGLLEYWEKRFWMTEFSHLGSLGNPTKSNLVLVTKASKDRPFDLDELKPLDKLKLKDILK